MTDRTFDLFLTHAWRYHDDWTRVADALDAVEGFAWRNFSVPWHDPAMDPNTEVGGRFIREWLENQVIPVDAVILLAGVYRLGSGRKWVELELEYAAKHDKIVFGVPPVGADPVAFPTELRARVVEILPWDGGQIVAAIRKSKEPASAPIV